VHDGTENHRRDHHLDQCDEAVTERLQALAEIREKIADQDAERDRDQDLNIEDLVPGLTPGGGTDRFCGHGRLAWGEKELAAMMGDRRAADNENSRVHGRFGRFRPALHGNLCNTAIAPGAHLSHGVAVL